MNPHQVINPFEPGKGKKPGTWYGADTKRYQAVAGLSNRGAIEKFYVGIPGRIHKKIG
jgi:hypothetical protein